MNRRRFLGACGAGLAALAGSHLGRAQTPRRPQLRIARITVQRARGRRLTPVAPNAYAGYRGYDRVETVVRIQTAEGLEGFGPSVGPADKLSALLGRDPFALFNWSTDDRILGRGDAHAATLHQFGGTDIALLDLLGRALKRPIASLLGAPAREAVPVYNSCVYMEDLLTPEQCAELAYLDGATVSDPVERVARKAAWVLRQPEGFQALKIKIGRSKWMRSPAEAQARDVAVTEAVRAAIGPAVKLYVDGNKDYDGRAQAAAAYAESVRGAKVEFLEQMLPDTDAAGLSDLRTSLRAAGNPVRLAGGETELGGLPKEVYTRRVTLAGRVEPLLDIEQGDMGRNGFLTLREKAAVQRPLGMTMAPHNFGSKLGFYAQVHLGLVVPNWEASEIDDVEFPAFRAGGIEVKGGVARLTGRPGLGVDLDERALDAPTLELKV